MTEIIHIGDVTVAVSPIDTAQPGAASRRAAERAAVASAVSRLLPPGTEIRHRDDGAPYIEGGPYVSVTHCRDFAAVAICEAHPVGIDAEVWRDALRRVAPRFLTEAEMQLTADNAALLRAWTVKEAVYKIAGAPAYDFRNIAISPDFSRATVGAATYALTGFSSGDAAVTVASPVGNP